MRERKNKEDNKKEEDQNQTFHLQYAWLSEGLMAFWEYIVQ